MRWTLLNNFKMIIDKQISLFFRKINILRGTKNKKQYKFVVRNSKTMNIKANSIVTGKLKF